MRRADLYVLVPWPESQELMERKWFNECILATPTDNHPEVGSSAYFVPVNRMRHTAYRSIKIARGKNGNISIPAKSKGRSNKYPFENMKVGDMFELSYDRITHQSVYGCIRNYKKKNPRKKFSIRTSKPLNWIRVWRTN